MGDFSKTNCSTNQLIKVDKSQAIQWTHWRIKQNTSISDPLQKYNMVTAVVSKIDQLPLAFSDNKTAPVQPVISHVYLDYN